MNDHNLDVMATAGEVRDHLTARRLACPCYDCVHQITAEIVGPDASPERIALVASLVLMTIPQDLHLAGGNLVAIPPPGHPLMMPTPADERMR